MVPGTRTSGALVLAALVVLVALASPVLTTRGLPSDESKAEHFSEIAQRARDKVDELMAVADSLNLTLPEELASDYTMADGLLESANQSFYDGDFEEARGLYKESMRAFRQLYGQIYTILEDAGVDLEADAGKGVSVAFERAQARFERVEGILNRSEAAGMNVTEARILLAEAQALLEEVLDLLEQALVDEAEQKLGEVNSLIAHALASTKGAAGRFNVKRIHGFTQSSESRLKGLEKQIDSEEGRGHDVDALRELLTEAQSLIQQAQELADSGDADEAIVTLDLAGQTIDLIKEGLKALKGNGPP